MTTALAEPSTWQTDCWAFHSVSELRKALEEYGEYDMAEGAPSANGDNDEKRDRRGRIYAQNLEIDRGMVLIGAASPYAWCLLDRYFCKGVWAEFRGWVGVARSVGLPLPDCWGFVRCRIVGDDRLDLPACRSGVRCQQVKTVFEEHLELCLEALLAACEFRRGRVD